jgi:hypothetical protein
MEYDPKYTVVVMDKKFVLTKSQIEFDGPNYFTACFLGDFCEAQTRHIELSRNPDLFQIIVNYLCGYSVLPLDENYTPSSMAPATALVNLRADAAFYQLDGLIQACDEHLADQQPVTEEKYLALLGMSAHPENVIDHGNNSTKTYFVSRPDIRQRITQMLMFSKLTSHPIIL